MFSELIKYSEEMEEIFQKHKIEKVYVFGSAACNNIKEGSDIDFLIKFKKGLNPLEKGTLWWNLHDTLRDIFKREIDIVTEDSLKNPYFIKEIENTKIMIYG